MIWNIISSHSEVFCWKDALKICSKFTGEHPCQSEFSIKLQSNFIEIVLRLGCFPVNLLYIFRTPFPENTSKWLLIKYTLLLLKMSHFTIVQTIWLKRINLMLPKWFFLIKIFCTAWLINQSCFVTMCTHIIIKPCPKFSWTSSILLVTSFSRYQIKEV